MVSKSSLKTAASVLLGMVVGSLISRPVPSVVTVEESVEADRKDSSPRPLQIFPLLKELRTGWGNMGMPPLLKRNAAGTRALVVDVGLDQGEEFFGAITNGFEVVGLEANPKSFQILAEKCKNLPNCEIVDIQNATLPLQRQPGRSYLIHAAAGASRGEMAIHMKGPASSIVTVAGNGDQQTATVPVIRVDEVVQEDVWLFKIDTQGFDYHVLNGASKLFKNHVVRQVITEVEPYTMLKQTITLEMLLELLQGYGLMCFTARKDNKKECVHLGDSSDGFSEMYFKNMRPAPSSMWAFCWEDFLCLNVEKTWPGPEVPLA